MKITKYGHSCLLIEDHGTRMLTDPGVFSTPPEDITVDAILITHKHPDHFDAELVKRILGKNNCPIYTNQNVGEELNKASIAFTALEHGQKATVGAITIEGFGDLHALMYEGWPQDPNVGYLFNDHLFHPGDAWTVPSKLVPVLALPVGGPWMKLGDAVDYAKQVKPKAAFPIHDGMFKSTRGTVYHTLPEKYLNAEGIQFTPLNDGESLEI